MEVFTAKDGKKVVLDSGSVRLYDPKELLKQKEEIEKRLAEIVEPTDKELLSWAKINYPIADHSAEKAELARIDSLITLLK